MSWLKTLSVPKVITVLCVLGLGFNGMVQIGLQKGIQAKAQQLDAHVRESKELSGDMKDGLVELEILKETTLHMEGTLGQLKTYTGEMSEGLGRLDQTVKGIDQAVSTIGNTTQASGDKIGATEDTARQLLVILLQINDINGTIISDLQRMIESQRTINRNLEDMNRKTRFLPGWGGSP
ncbi:hypothetical protein [Effusibacillus lacus]|uniref:Uncharacterized protein n=1 Tax=Effusibacillus lacus TaxID=1348429 RepID=A0A292YN06_9BACL|nr:hypothetical protein [Effusibacillus lacus]TCS68160.1 hypothetical protein EDD64_14512 [Effusibacillus lacus]GAX90291.1 hypothetical protein EFBL_1917 [Effusibacillus lacus]